MVVLSSVLVGVPAQQPVAFRGSDPDSYLNRVHAGDVIDIRVVGNLEYDWRGGLTPEGFLDGFEKIPKQIFALCRSEDEIAKEITGELGTILRNPQTEVRILDRTNRAPATIEGAITTPLRFQLKRPARLNELIIAAGGITDRASGEIMISRSDGLSCVQWNSTSGDRQVSNRTVRIGDLISGNAEANPVIVSGDLVVIFEASPVFLLGAVGNQGRIDHRPELTVSRAVDSAGGMLKDAVPERVTIFRREKGSTSTIQVDLNKIKSHLSEDVVLKPFDIIDVPFKGKPPRKLPPVFEAEYVSADRRSKLPLKIIE
jgi:protein involved in polysaccharide export with SLBB domain